MRRSLLHLALVLAALAASVVVAAPANTTSAASARVKAALGDTSLHPLLPGEDEPVQANLGVIKPDLVITDMVWSPATYLPPANLSVTVVVQNTGPANAGPFHVICSGAGIIMPKSMFIAAGLKHGASVNCLFNFKYSAGPEPANAFVDYNNEVAENDETNNSRSSPAPLEASAYDFYAQDIELIYPPGLPLVGGDTITQPVGDMPVVIKGTFGYINKVDNKPLKYSVNFYTDGMIRKSYDITIPANGMTEVLHPVTLPGGSHTIKIGASGIHVDKTWEGNELEKTWYWRGNAKAPYRHGYASICTYEYIGGGASNLPSYCLYEARRFAIRMKEFGHPHTWHTEQGDINWPDWGGGAAARANQGEIAFFSGHGNWQGPAYCGRSYDGDKYMMGPGSFSFGKDTNGNPSVRWIIWSCCETLYDGVTDQSHINWDQGDLALSRWFQVFNGLHCIVGNRSLGTVGWWNHVTHSGDTSQRGTDFANQISYGVGFSWAWYLATRWCVWDEIDAGFETAVLSADAEGTDYSTETLPSPYPDYASPPNGYYYESWRIGSPSW